jgi:hypothetical protein
MADPADAVVEVDRCEVADGVVQVVGRLENTSGADQAFVVHIGVVFEDELFDGLTVDAPVPSLPDGDQRAWSASGGSVDPEDDLGEPECRVDRVGLADQLPA